MSEMETLLRSILAETYLGVLTIFQSEEIDVDAFWELGKETLVEVGMNMNTNSNIKMLFLLPFVAFCVCVCVCVCGGGGGVN